jgi:hypothetical protein
MADEPTTSEFAERTQRDCVCAGCWGHLVIYNRRGVLSIECPNCGPERGFVTRAGAEHRRSENSAEYLDATQNLSKILGLPVAQKTDRQILSELGF